MLTISRRLREWPDAVLSAVALLASVLIAMLATPAIACPDWRQNGQTVTYDWGQLDLPQRFSFQAGGSNNLTQCPAPGMGWAATAPHLTMGLRGQGGDRDLIFRVEAPCDTVLLVNDATAQWHFNDDSQGLNPGLTLRAAQDGVYDVWVGTYGQSACQATLIVQLGGVGQDSACPSVSTVGTQLTPDAAELRTGLTVGAMAGGARQLRDCEVQGSGYVDESPQYTLDVPDALNGADLELAVTAGCDTVLLVNDSQGDWHFNDDSDGLNPRLMLHNIYGGSFNIWIGTYNPTPCSAQLTLRSSGGPAPAPVAPPELSKPGHPVGVQPVAPPLSGWTAGRLRVLSASYGANCGTAPGNVTAHIAAACNGQQSCSYTVDHRVIGDPAVGCSKDYAVTYECGDGEVRTASLPPEASGRRLPELICPAQIMPQGQPPAPAVTSLPDPGNMIGFRDRVGAVVSIELTGAAAGSVWGTDVYSDDSSLARAAVHAGVLRVGETGVVHVEVMPGQSAYQGSDRFGVTTANWGSWTGSFRFVRDSSAVMPRATGARFELVVVPEGITFDAARQRAEAMGGHLATITSEAESREVWAVADVEAAWITSSSGYSAGPWLGGHRISGAPGWAWITGEPWSFTAWSPGQPDNSRGIETHLALFSRTTQRAPTWNDAPASSTLRGFILERPAGTATGQPSVQIPAAAGDWSLVGNNYRGRLVLSWSGGGWTGHVRYDVHGRDEPLDNIRFDPGSGRIEFTRPIPGATQIYRGVLTGARIDGQFNQNGGNYIYNWTATR